MSRTVVIASFVVALLLGLFLFFRYQSILRNQTGSIPPNNIKDMLINDSAIQRIKSDYDKRLRDSGRSPQEDTQYDFHYKLSPSLTKDQSQLLNTSTKVLGASSCNFSSAPGSVSVYELKNQIDGESAAKIAKEFGITDKATSLPPKDGTFQYFFSNKETDGNLSLYASSGTYIYHKVLKPKGGDTSQSSAQGIATDEIKKHKLEKTLGTPVITDNGETYSFHYVKQWDDFAVVDLNSIVELGVTGNSVCSTKISPAMNYVEVYVTKDGQLARFINQTRTSTTKVTVSRLTIAEAVKAFDSSKDLPVKPIVVPEGSSLKSGDVEITDAALVYFDYGNVFPQKLYIPFYLTTGKVPGHSSKVYTLFPAVSPDKLAAAGVSVSATSKGKQTIQIDVYVPPPTGTFACVNGNCCFGGQVDCTVSCKDKQGYSCTAFRGIKPDQDPFGVCKSGVSTKTGTVDGEGNFYKACQDFGNSYYKDTKPFDNFTPAEKSLGNGLSIGTFTANCTLTCSPC